VKLLASIEAIDDLLNWNRETFSSSCCSDPIDIGVSSFEECARNSPGGCKTPWAGHWLGSMLAELGLVDEACRF
jgi:hypothetical protein